MDAEANYIVGLAQQESSVKAESVWQTCYPLPKGNGNRNLPIVLHQRTARKVRKAEGEASSGLQANGGLFGSELA